MLKKLSSNKLHIVELTADNIKKILIIKLAAIGDVLFASPLVDNLRKNFPEAQIHWLGDSWTRDTLEHIPHIDKLFFYQRPWFRSRIKGYLEIPFLLKKLRAEHYDLAIIPHRSGLAFRLARFAGINVKVGFVNGGPDKDLDVSVSYDSSKHEVERNLDLLRALQLNIFNSDMVYKVESSVLKKVREKYLKNGNEKLVCMAPGGGKNPGLYMPLKKWPKEKFADLAKELSKKGARIILLGSSGDEEVCEYIAAKTDVLNLCLNTTLEESAAIIKCADLFIGNDSGPLYIAAAQGTPTLGIYGPSDPVLVAPSGTGNAYIAKKVDCAPCYRPDSAVQGELTRCEHGQVCLKDLDTKDVFKKAITLLEGNG